MRDRQLALSALAVIVLTAGAVCLHVRSLHAVQRLTRKYPADEAPVF